MSVRVDSPLLTDAFIRTVDMPRLAMRGDMIVVVIMPTMMS